MRACSPRTRISTVHGDAYSGEWVRTAFQRHGIRYVPSERPKSQLYLDALPLLNAGTAVLLDNARLVSQLSQLERRTARSGRDSIDHMKGGSGRSSERRLWCLGDAADNGTQR